MRLEHSYAPKCQHYLCKHQKLPFDLLWGQMHIVYGFWWISTCLSVHKMLLFLMKGSLKRDNITGMSSELSASSEAISCGTGNERDGSWFCVSLLWAGVMSGYKTFHPQSVFSHSLHLICKCHSGPTEPRLPTLNNLKTNLPVETTDLCSQANFLLYYH